MKIIFKFWAHTQDSKIISSSLLTEMHGQNPSQELDPNSVLSLSLHRRHRCGSHHLLKFYAFLKQVYHGASRLSSVHRYLASLFVHGLSQHLHIFKQRPICLHCNWNGHGACLTIHCVLQCKVWNHSLGRSGSGLRGSPTGQGHVFPPVPSPGPSPE